MWRNRITKPCTKATAIRSVRPALEQLEDRVVPTNITYHGGPTIPNVQVTNIVMGTPQADTTSIMQAIVKDYLPILNTYYGIGSGTLQGSVSVAAPASNPTATDLQNLITSEIQSGAVPQPGPNQVYMIFLAPGQYVAGTEGGYGHSWPTANGKEIYWAFVPGEYPPNSTAFLAGAAMADTVTDPEGNGWNDSSLQHGDVGDIYAADTPTAPILSLDGYHFSYLSGPQGQMIPTPPSPPPPLGGGGNVTGSGGTVGGRGSTPTFIQAAITLYVDGVESIFQGDSAALEQSIQANLPYAIFAGIDFGEFFVLSGELAAYNALHGNNQG